MRKNNKKKQQQIFQRLLQTEKEQQQKQEAKRQKKKQKYEAKSMAVDEPASNPTDQMEAPSVDWNTFNSLRKIQVTNNNNNNSMQDDDDDDYDMSIELPHKKSSAKQTEDAPQFSREVKRQKPRKYYAKRLKKEEKKAQMQSD